VIKSAIIAELACQAQAADQANFARKSVLNGSFDIVSASF